MPPNASKNAFPPHFTPSQKTGKILVVEDDPSVRAFIARALEEAGHKVNSVEDGDLALQILNQQSFDVMIADIRMPRVDGLTLAHHAEKSCPAMRVVLITGFPIERQRAADQTDSFAVLSKPFTLTDIQTCVSVAVRDVFAERAA